MTVAISPRHISLAWFTLSVAATPFAGTHTLSAVLGASVGFSLLFVLAFYNLEYQWVRVE